MTPSSRLPFSVRIFVVEVEVEVYVPSGLYSTDSRLSTSTESASGYFAAVTSSYAANAAGAARAKIAAARAMALSEFAFMVSVFMVYVLLSH